MSSENKKVEASFLQFASGMAAQTLMHMGIMENPITGECKLDLVNAKYSIELLEILKQKTKGNLTEEEENYFNAALDDLKIRFASVTSGADNDK
jgi:hypothetical protein